MVGVSGASAGGGVARVNDTDVEQFDDWAGDDVGAKGIGSVAYNESTGGMIAGEYLGNKVYSWSKITGSSPDAQRPNTQKPPSGGATNAHTLVGWSGDTAVAATSGDESAFAISTDEGYAWNDISLIDTTLATINDISPSADGSVLYMTSYDGLDASVWVKASSWMRVLSRKDQPSGEAAFLVRQAPEDSSVVYVSASSDRSIWVSKNMGKSTWKKNTAGKLSASTGIQDFVVESADVIHAIDTTSHTVSTNAGASWRSAVSLDMSGGYMITLAPNNDILVGSDGGYVSFSKDGGTSFTKISDRVDGSGSVQVVADVNYADNNRIYAGRGSKVERGKAGKNDDWSGRGSLESTDSVVGMAQIGDVIYALSTNGTDSRLYRALNLRDADTTALALWSGRKASAYNLGATPQALKLSADYSGGPRLWAIDQDSTMTVRRITDPIATVGPTLSGPANGASIPVNAESGVSYDVTFSWSRYSSKYIVSMDIEVATDSSFDAKIVDFAVTDIDADGVAQVIGPGMTDDNAASFMPGNTYYWRVRHSDVDAPGGEGSKGQLMSPWSEVRSFSIEAPISFALTSPSVGATSVALQPTFVWTTFEGAIGYEVAVSEDSSFAILDWSHSVDSTFYQTEEKDMLSYSTTYYWRVRGVTGPAPSRKAAPGGPWVSGVFTTEAAPAPPPPPPVVIEPTPPAPPPQIVTVEVPVPGPPQAIPATLLWAIVSIGAILIIALIVLIVRTRRVA